MKNSKVCSRSAVVPLMIGILALACGSEHDKSSPEHVVNTRDLTIPRPNVHAAPPPRTLNQAERASLISRALAPTLNRSSVGLESFQHPSGVRVIRLKQRFHDAIVVRTRADGTREQACFDDAERAGRFLSGAKP